MVRHFTTVTNSNATEARRAWSPGFILQCTQRSVQVISTAFGHVHSIIEIHKHVVYDALQSQLRHQARQVYSPRGPCVARGMSLLETSSCHMYSLFLLQY